MKGVGVPAGVNEIPCSGPAELITPRCETVEVWMLGRMLLAGVPGTLARLDPARPKFSHSSEHQLRVGHLPMPPLFSYSPPTTRWPRPPSSDIPPASEY